MNFNCFILINFYVLVKYRLLVKFYNLSRPPEMPAVRWVGGSEMEALAIATGAKIVGRFEDLSPAKLGTAGLIREVAIGSSSDKMILVENCPNSRFPLIPAPALSSLSPAPTESSPCFSELATRWRWKRPSAAYTTPSAWSAISCSTTVSSSAAAAAR